MECFTLWTADQWLMNNSFVLQGVFSTIENAIQSAKDLKLLSFDNHVLIRKGIIDNYDATEETVFSTCKDEDYRRLES